MTPPDFETTIEVPYSPSSIPLFITIAGVVLGVAVIAGIVAITTLRPAGDNATIVAVLPAFAAVTLASIFSALKASEAAERTNLNRAEIQKLAISINGRLAQLLIKTAEAERLAGQMEGRAAAKEEIIPLIKEEVVPAAVKSIIGANHGSNS